MQMQNSKKILKLILFIFLVIPVFSFAENYNLLEPIPGFGATTVSDPSAYIKAVYQYILGLTIALSVLMLVVGGVEYTLTFTSEANKGKAKTRIENAIIGLIIALTGYLVLYIINPDLVKMSFDTAGENCGVTAGGGGGAGWDENTTQTGQADGTGGGGANW